MSGATLLHRAINRVYKRERDPRRATRVWRHFDLERGYAEYHARCREWFRRERLPEVPVALEQRGFADLRALQTERARAIGRELAAREPERLKKDSRDLEGYPVADRAWLRGLLDEILPGAVDAAVSGFFRSEYLVHWVALAVTRPVPEQKSVSFRWHCDKGPTAHLKLIVYLNDTAEHGGNTEFIDLRDTAAVARRGYLFGWSKTRTADVNRLARLAGRPLDTHVADRAAGEAVLFQPARVLHRGLGPRNGPRLTATLCLLPSPVHWQRALECETLSDLAVDEKWHGNALQFLDAFQQRLDGPA
ncbi:hypothetical protein [Elongatibacter sediminis]|uniref:Fe2OG dioxygenase domain-containing protein n=1 Tax=Elongatibacter sediminis TaxID=3119006 RepID=A0AAW9RKZ1_9GAMM